MAVGVALSWWEGSEDVIMGLFNTLVGRREPTASKIFVASPRGRRVDMLKSALTEYKKVLLESEIGATMAALRSLDKLAQVRNEIAHGHCSEFTKHAQGGVVMSGFYLLPALNEGHWHERSMRYAHNAETIHAFTTSVRLHRATIMDVQIAVALRQQASQEALTLEESQIVAAAEAIAAGNMRRERITQVLALRSRETP